MDFKGCHHVSSHSLSDPEYKVIKVAEGPGVAQFASFGEIVNKCTCVRNILSKTTIS